MIFRNLIFEAEVVKQRLRAGLVPHHEQQTSECSGEQQHRELWPAYNPNLALPQASTEGLFQQTRLISTVTTTMGSGCDAVWAEAKGSLGRAFSGRVTLAQPSLAVVVPGVRRGRTCHARYGAQVLIDGPQVMVSHVLEIEPRHDLQKITIERRRHAACVNVAG